MFSVNVSAQEISSDIGTQNSSFRISLVQHTFSGFVMNFDYDSGLDMLELHNPISLNNRIKEYQSFIIPELVWETQCHALFVDASYFRDKDYRWDEFHHYR